MAPEYSIAPFTGQGLGLSHSSLNKVGLLLPFRKLGQAEIACHLNLANGNLVLKDHVIRIAEIGNVLELGWVYNSKATTLPLSWRLAVAGEFANLPDPNSPVANLTYIEADGHETSYIFSAEKNCYIAAEFSDGQPYLYYKDNKQWVLYHPKNGVMENYAQNGKLSSRVDREGRTTRFLFDAQNQLKAIVGASGTPYIIDRSVPSVISFYTYQKGLKIPLQKHIFQDGLLITTQSGDEQYSTQYEYEGNSNRLRSVTQTDGTNYGFTYDSNLTKRINQIRVGETLNNITYKASSSIFQDSFGSQTTLEFNSAAQIIKLTQQRGYDAYQNPPDITHYSYYPSGQLENIIRPNGGVERNNYDANNCNLISMHSLPEGQLTQYSYTAAQANRPQLSTIIETLNKDTVAVTRYVYDNNFDNAGNIFLRFSISSEGRVTERRPDPQTKNPATIRAYFDVLFTDSLVNNQAPSLARMLQWIATIDPQQVRINDYRYNERGQAKIVRSYGHVDAQGNGINDSSMSQITTDWDLLGGWGTKEILQSAAVTSIAKQKYDLTFHRLIEKADLISKENNQLRYRETKYQYQDTATPCNVIVTLPNGQEQQQQLDTQGLVISESDSGVINTQMQVRTTLFERDTGGRIVETIGPDGKMMITFFDRQQRLGFTVSPLGRVNEWQYDRVNRFKTTIRYENPIDITKLVGKYLPTASTLIGLVEKGKNPELDRYTYEFYDYTDRVRYEVDEENFVTEYIYDNLNRKTATIIYKQPLDNEMLAQLKQGKSLVLIPNSDVDQWWQYFYDTDNNPIVEQDPAGYVIQKKYDAGNRCYEKIHYGTPTPHTRNLNEVIPPEDKLKDAHTFYYYNSRDEVILEVDAENYVTSYTYYASGLKKTATRYDTRLDKNWYENTDNNNFIPLIPPASSEDQTTYYEYDLVNRLVKMTLPFNKNIEKSFDDMDNILLETTYDGKVNENYDADTLRAHAKLYDQFLQLYREADSQDINQDYYEHFYDASGLKLKSVNPLGHPIYYFYDLDRRPIVVINARGAIIESTLNSFSEPVQMRAYEQKISPTDLLLLTGGFITPEFRTTLNALQQEDKDAITRYVRNKRGLAEKITDPENYVTQKTYTAFKQLDEEILPLSNATHYKIKHEYDIRGLEAKIAKIASDNREITNDRYEYNNQFGVKTAHYDALDYKTQFINDRLGRRVQVIDPENVTRETLALDAFERVITNTNSLSQVTTNRYDQATRSQKITYPKGNSELIIKNVFSENLSHEDGVNNKEIWRHESAGHVTQHAQEVPSEAKNYVIEDGYDVIHLHNSHVDANKNQTQFINNSVGTLEQIIIDSTNAELITKFELDAWERKALEIDPLLNRTSNSHDKRNLLTQKIIDPVPPEAPLGEQVKHLNLIHTTQYNGQQTKSFEMRGDTPLGNIYNAAFEQDAINRDIGKIIDLPTPGKSEHLNLTSTLALDGVNQVPAKTEPLNLKSKLVLDAVNQTVAAIDEHGYITYNFYDKCGRERFKVDPENGVSEKRYNTEGDVIYECHYKSILTQPISEQTTLAQMVDFATSLHTLEDKELWFFYDENRLESFTLNNLGAVTEKRYDAANRKVADILYATKVDVLTAKNNTTPQMAALMKANPSALDRKTSYVLSPNIIITDTRLERFTIDPEGYVLESRFDDNGNTITEILYAQKVANPDYVATLSIAEIYTHLKSDDPKNETTFTVYDVRNNPIYRVYPEGNVTSYEYDKNGNKTLECRFDHKLDPVPQDYAVLVATLKTPEWVPDKTKGDRITTFGYDAANRRCKVTDPRGNSEEFTYDAMGNKLTHTDKNKAVWSYLYDRDNREIAFTAPKSNITLVSYDPALGATGQLIATEDAVSVTRQKIYNKENNSTTIIEGAGRSDAREMTLYNNKCNKLISIEVPRAAVDNPNAQASFKNPPVIESKVSSNFIYDGKCQQVVATDELGNVTFFVHDSMGNQRFVIDGEGGITETQFDAFNQSTQETKYAKSLDPVKLKKDYASKDITLAAMTDLMVGIPDITKDPTTKFKRDRRGNITLEKKGPIFNYCANVAKPDTPSYGTTLTQFKKDYNARGKCCLESKLIDHNTATWSTTWYWYDRNGNKVAIVDPDLYVTIDIMNSFNEVGEHYEYANPLLETPDPAMSVAALIKKVIQNPEKDRITKTDYNANGSSEKITYVNADFQKLVKENNIYSLFDVTRDLIISQTHTKTEKLSSITDAKENTCHFYYDERDIEIACTGVPRKSLDDNNNPLTLVPLTYYGVNFAGERVRTRRFKQGAEYPLKDTPPAKKQADPEDQQELIINNTQGKPAYKQDAQKNLCAMTYTATQKEARSWHQLSNWHFDASLPLKFKSESVMAEKRSSYDGRNLLLVSAFYTTAYDPLSKSELVKDRSTYRIRDSFGQIIAEGQDGVTYPLRYEYDLVGHVWKSNSGQGAYYLKLQNAAGEDTLTIRSPNRNFESLSYQDLPQVMTWDIVSTLRTEQARSLNGNIIAELLPAYVKQGNMQSLPVPLCMQPVQQQTETGAQYLITFPLPQERAYQLKFFIKTHGGVGQTELPIILTDAEHCAVDVSHLASDLYDYDLRYQIRVPGEAEPVLVYQTQGSVQFDSDNSTTSHNLVALSVSDTTVKLTGKTAGLTKLELWQGEQKIADIPYQDETLLDLSAYPSGAYSLKPFYNALAGTASLPFTLYTLTPAPAPLSQEINFSISLTVEGQTAQVTRQINPSFADKTLRLTCDYVGTDDEPYQQSVTFNPSDNQFSFDHEVKSIASLSVDLAMPPSANEPETLWIPLLIAAIPDPQTAAKQKGARRYQALFPDAKGQLTQAKYFERTRLQHADIFEMLGTSAHDFVTTLSNLNPEIAANALAEEIFEALNSGRFMSSQDAAWQTLLQQQQIQQAVMKKLIQRLEKALNCDVYHLDSQGVYALLQNNDQMPLLKEYLQTEVALAEGQREQINFCQDKAVVAEYISFLTTHFPGDKSVLLFSKAKNIPVTCWAANKANPTQMKMLGDEASTPDSQHLFIHQGQVYASLREVGKPRLAKQKHAALNAESDWVVVDNLDKNLNEWLDLASGKSLQIVNAVFAPRTLLYITPFAPFTEMPTVTFLDMSTDRNAQIANLTPLPLITDLLQSLVLDVSDLPVGIYPYKVATYENVFSITHGNPVYPSQSYPTKIDGSFTPILTEAKLAIIHPIRRYAYNAWRDRIQEITATGGVTNKEFSFCGREKKRIDPPVSCYLEEIIEGKVKYTLSATPVRPTTYNGYDETGCFIGMTNPKGNTSAVIVDEAGQE
ncbi:MAG: RHS repeat protein, partial [Gammaproteobacteria bacterium]|nr:RHS repeat protein [Gammaproteobacteria bacterium]